MKILRKNLHFLIIVLLTIMMTSCEKDAGVGGNSAIKGNIHVTDYNASFVIIQGDYPGVDEDVYIIYGNDISYGDKLKAGPDGNFEFKYLRKGSYTIYVYSQDTSLSGKTVVSKKIEITGNKKTVDAGIFEIKKS